MIKLNDLAIGYNGEAILEHIDQEFDDGLIYGILAKSGAGKTTLLKTISGLLHPVHGEVVIDGTTYRNADKNPVYMMHQRYSNFGWLSCTENVVKEAQTVYEAYDKKLRELKKQSRMTVEEMKLRGNMKDLLGDLDELRRDSATDKLLGSVRDGAEDLRKEVDGAIVVHASRTTTKMSMAEKNAAKAQSDAYLQSLATKYNGKPAIQAPRSGVTFDAPKSKVKEERK